MTTGVPDGSAATRGARATTSASVAIGKIVRSDSHVRYTCQVFGAHEVAAPPAPEDYAFGAFVRVPLRMNPALLGVARYAPRLRAPARDADVATLQPTPNGADALAPHSAPAAQPDAWAIGLIYDTLLVNPAFGAFGPRLSNDEQVAIFSPDYLAERAVLISLLLLGVMLTPSQASPAARYPASAFEPYVTHGIPPVAPELGAEISILPDGWLRDFHHFADHAAPGGARPYLHMGYLPHAIAQENALLPMALLGAIERLERLFPEHAALLAIVKRNFAWRLKVQALG